MPSFHLLQVELGVPAGLAYELTFNKYGLRICFTGISQNIAAYARRICSRLVVHHESLSKEAKFSPSLIAVEMNEVNRQRAASLLRKRRQISALKEVTPIQAAAEGKSFLASCSGGLCLAQGDFLPKEAICLIQELQEILGPVIDQNGARQGEPAIPELPEILYKPGWKPRSGALCLIPGMSLICDACGRIPR